MSFTHSINTSSADKIVFEREPSASMTTMFIAGGLLLVFFGLLAPLNLLLKILVILFGILFASASTYVPKLIEEYTPKSAIIFLDLNSIFVLMADKSEVMIPFNHIKSFEILEEKRSPSAANSKGINYIHYHLVIRRKNDAVWELTSTTDKQKAEEMLKFLRTSVNWDGRERDLPTPVLSKKILVRINHTTEASWQNNRYKLLIGTEDLEFHEYDSTRKIINVKKFRTNEIEGAVYSYTNFISSKAKNVRLAFHSASGSDKQSLFFKDLNPVECLQFEYWLNDVLSKKRNNQV